ncbi:WD repeat-containing protein 35 [Halotydeus destructor]|nr:WD repeat-containing protein 35 [Halotydeus destructor]
MFIYTSKKIAVPNSQKVKCVAWSHEHGFIACGGDNGLLKVIKLDSTSSDGGHKSLVAPKNLSMNQNLEGHNGTVVGCLWNELYQKLTSCDDSGLIIVWMLYKGSWYEEMINNRNRSNVTGMAWSTDGQKICIVYDDGAVIVGSVDGNRQWGKDLKGQRLTQVEWSPDDKMLLIGLQSTEIHVFDDKGNFMSALSLPVIQGVFGRMSGSAEIARLLGMQWNKMARCDSYALAIAFENGRIQLMRNECDESPKIINTDLLLTDMKWNAQGTVLAVTGQSEEITGDKDKCIIALYDNFGEPLQRIVLAGKEINGCSWEKEGLRIAIAVDCYLFFANIRPDYIWAYFSSILVYNLKVDLPKDADLGTLSQKSVQHLVFWNTVSKEKHTKSVKNLVNLAACGQYCVLITKNLDELESKQHSLCSLVLCNSIGTSIDTVPVSENITKVAMNSNQVVAVSSDSFVVWSFSASIPQRNTSALSRISRQDYMAFKYDIDDTDDSARAKSRRSSTLGEKMLTTFVSRTDPISCLAVSEKILVIGLKTGKFEVYLLPQVTLLQSFGLGCKPHKLALNCDSSKLAIIETSAIAVLYDLEAQDKGAKQEPGKLLAFEKKDVWDIMWASDNPDLFAITEKNKLLIYKDLECDDSDHATGHLMGFSDLIIRTVDLDSLVNEQPTDDQNLENYINDMETKMLKDARGVLERVGVSDAIPVIEEMGHQRLWRLLAETALRQLDLENAEVAMVRCKDFKSIQFVKRLAKLQNADLKRAEILAYFGEFDAAEKVYLECDRKDLAINLGKTLGNYSRVVELIKSDLGATSDDEIRDVMSKVGDYCAERLEWKEAIEYYEESGRLDKLYRAYCCVEDYSGLKRLLENFEPDPALLLCLGETFESVGMCSEAVNAYVRANRVQDAVNCCVHLNEWNTAIALAREHDLTDIDELLSKYASHLLEKKRFFDVVELYRKANRTSDAANMLLKIIEDSKHLQGVSSLLLKKKLYTLIGLLHEEQSSRNSSKRDVNKRRNTLTSLLRDDEGLISAAVNFKAIDQPWKGAEAYHLWLLAQRQLYDGYLDAAMRTALHLRDYEDFIDCEDIYALIALTSCVHRFFAICSKAFIKLESLETISGLDREDYKELAINVFTTHVPKESRNVVKAECTYCETMIPDYCSSCPSCNTKFPICMASGRPIMDPKQQWTCSRCSHHSLKTELTTLTVCPLCHFVLLLSAD